MSTGRSRRGKGCLIALAVVAAIAFLGTWGLIAWSFLDEGEQQAADAAGAAADPRLRQPLVSTDGRIAFVVQRKGSEDIYVVDAGGARLTRIMRLDGTLDGALSWSADGRRLAFTSDDVAYIVHTVGGDASSWRTTSEQRGQRRIWSPDAQRAALVPATRSRTWGVAISEGASVADITGGWPAAPYGYVDSVSWSSDGRRLAFAHSKSVSRRMPGPSPGNIYVVNADGSGFSNVTKYPDDTRWEPVGNLAWSPDGQRFAFWGGRGCIVTVAVDGSDRVELPPTTMTQYMPHVPAWSPDSRWLASSNDHGIVVSGPRGEALRELTRGRAAGVHPAWSPDGTRIAFADSWNGKLYVMNSDGSGLTLLAEMPRDLLNPPVLHRPTWQPGAP